MDRVIEERPNESQLLNFKQKIWLTRREKKNRNKQNIITRNKIIS